MFITPDVTPPPPGALERLLGGLGSGLEVISRPGRVVEEGIAELTGGGKKATVQDILLRGKRGTEGRELVDQMLGGKLDRSTPWHDPSNVGRAVGGFAVDVLADPLTYLTAGAAPLIKSGGKVAIKKLVADGVAEPLARKQVMEMIEGGAKDLGKRAGVRFMGKNIANMPEITAAGEATRIAPLGRKIRDSGVGQAFGDRFIPGFMPKGARETLGEENQHLWPWMFEKMRSQDRLGDLRQAGVIKAIQQETKGFTEDEVRLITTLVENPRLRREQVKSLNPELQGALKRIRARQISVSKAQRSAGIISKHKKNYMLHAATDKKNGPVSSLPREITGTIDDVNEKVPGYFEDKANVLHGITMATAAKKITQAEGTEDIMRTIGQQLQPGMEIPKNFWVVKRDGTNLKKVPRSVVVDMHEIGETPIVRGSKKVDAEVDVPKKSYDWKEALDENPEMQKLMGFEPVPYRMASEAMDWLPTTKKVSRTEIDEAVKKKMANYYIMPKEMAQAIMKHADAGDIDELGGSYRKLMALWKGYTYGVRPGAQGRNALWNMIMLGASGVNPLKIPQRMRQAVDVMNTEAGAASAPSLFSDAYKYADVEAFKSAKGIADPRWGTANTYVTKNPHRTGRGPGEALDADAEDSWEIDQVINGGKPAFLGGNDGRWSDADMRATAATFGVFFGKTEHGAPILAKTKELLEEAQKATSNWTGSAANHRALGLALGYKDIGAFKSKQAFKEAFEQPAAATPPPALLPGIKTELGEKIPYSVVRQKGKELGIEGHGSFSTDLPGVTLRSRVEDVMGRGKPRLNPLDPNNALLSGGRRMGTAVENNARYAAFIDQLIKGETEEQAQRQANKYFFDYGALTPFEKQTMKQIAPFYTFARKNMALQPKLAAEMPGAYAALPKAKEAIESLDPNKTEDEYLPDYLKRNNAIRMPFKSGEKNPYYWLQGLGFEDLTKPLKPRDLAGSLSPAIKMPIEMMTNHNLYFGEAIEKVPGRPVSAPEGLAGLPAPLRSLLGMKEIQEGNLKGKQGMSAWTRYGLEQVPQMTALIKMFGGGEKGKAAALAFLSGIKLTEHDEERAKSYATGKFKKPSSGFGNVKFGER